MTTMVNEARAKEPLSRCLIGRLLVPNVYWALPDSPWAAADVIAVDRAGSGDIHVVEVKRPRIQAPQMIRAIMCVPAHYHWLAYFGVRSAVKSLARLRLFPVRTAPGRIGIIRVSPRPDGALGAEVEIPAERFQLPGADNLRQQLAQYPPDIDFK